MSQLCQSFTSVHTNVVEERIAAQILAIATTLKSIANNNNNQDQVQISKPHLHHRQMTLAQDPSGTASPLAKAGTGCQKNFLHFEDFINFEVNRKNYISRLF